jgi:hypothetical protein
MEAKTILKYKKKTLSQLIKLATLHFNKFIRERDKYKGCVSCGAKVEHAGHFYSAGHYSNLRFTETNCHGQCLRCNNFLHGNLNEYRKNITQRISEDDLKDLDALSSYYKKHPFKWDRFALIEIIEKYKNYER